MFLSIIKDFTLTYHVSIPPVTIYNYDILQVSWEICIFFCVQLWSKLIYLFTFQWLWDFDYLPVFAPILNGKIVLLTAPNTSRANVIVSCQGGQNIFNSFLGISSSTKSLDFLTPTWFDNLTTSNQFLKASENHNDFFGILIILGISSFFNGILINLPLSISNIWCLRYSITREFGISCIAILGVILGEITFMSSLILPPPFIQITLTYLESIWPYVFGLILIIFVVLDFINENSFEFSFIKNHKPFIYAFLLSFFEQIYTFSYFGNLNFGSLYDLFKNYNFLPSLSPFFFMILCLSFAVGSFFSLSFFNHFFYKIFDFFHKIFFNRAKSRLPNFKGGFLNPYSAERSKKIKQNWLRNQKFYPRTLYNEKENLSKNFPFPLELQEKISFHSSLQKWLTGSILIIGMTTLPFYFVDTTFWNIFITNHSFSRQLQNVTMPWSTLFNNNVLNESPGFAAIGLEKITNPRSVPFTSRWLSFIPPNELWDKTTKFTDTFKNLSFHEKNKVTLTIQNRTKEKVVTDPDLLNKTISITDQPPKVQLATTVVQNLLINEKHVNNMIKAFDKKGISAKTVYEGLNKIQKIIDELPSESLKDLLDKGKIPSWEEPMVLAPIYEVKAALERDDPTKVIEIGLALWGVLQRDSVKWYILEQLKLNSDILANTPFEDPQEVLRWYTFSIVISEFSALASAKKPNTYQFMALTTADIANQTEKYMKKFIESNNDSKVFAELIFDQIINLPEESKCYVDFYHLLDALGQDKGVKPPSHKDYSQFRKAWTKIAERLSTYFVEKIGNKFYHASPHRFNVQIEHRIFKAMDKNMQALQLKKLKSSVGSSVTSWWKFLNNKHNLTLIVDYFHMIKSGSEYPLYELTEKIAKDEKSLNESNFKSVKISRQKIKGSKLNIKRPPKEDVTPTFISKDQIESKNLSDTDKKTEKAKDKNQFVKKLEERDKSNEIEDSKSDVSHDTWSIDSAIFNTSNSLTSDEVQTEQDFSTNGFQNQQDPGPSRILSNPSTENFEIIWEWQKISKKKTKSKK